MMDFHCHLDLYQDPVHMVGEIVRRKTFVLSVTTTPTAYEKTSTLGAKEDCIVTGIGLHPQLVHQRANEASQIDDWIGETDFVGEIGLDGGPEYFSSWDAQIEVFEYALRLSSNKGGRILSIHSRCASTPVLDRLEKHSIPNTPILHWFSGTSKEITRACDIGCWFSVGPAMVAGKKGKKLLGLMPRDRVLLETDGPFTMLDGVPYQPWDAEHYCIPIIANEWSVSEEAVRLILKDNLKNILVKRHVSGTGDFPAGF